MPTPTQLFIYTDGGARGNPGPAAIGFVIKDQADQTITEQSAYIGHSTNNTAEYQAVIHALAWVKTNLSPAPSLKINFFLDSQLVANQLSGNYKIKQPHLRQLASQAQSLQTSLHITPTFTYIPRAQNHRADFLLNRELDSRLS